MIECQKCSFWERETSCEGRCKEPDSAYYGRETLIRDGCPRGRKVTKRTINALDKIRSEIIHVKEQINKVLTRCKMSKIDQS